MQPHAAEICIVGGGPAGSALALRLAQLGHDVLVVERAPFPRSHVGESLTPGVLPLLETLGVRAKVESAGFLRPDRAVVRWAAATDHWKSQSGEPGFQVDRGRFDQLLLGTAREAGARIIQPASAGRPIREGSGGWRVPVRDGATRVLCTRFLVDASGRRRWLPGPVRRHGMPTLALYGYWTGVNLPGPETRVEAGESAWYWGAPLPDGTVNATVFLDPEDVRGRDVQAHYRQLLARSILLDQCLEGRLVDSVRACNATAGAAEELVGPDWIRIGEAAMSLDPLSSQGVQSALGSALQAAVVVHTILSHPKRTEIAGAFYRDRCEELSCRHTALASAHYAEHRVWSDRLFWRRRSALQPPAEPARPDTAQSWSGVGLEAELTLSPKAVLRDTPCIVGTEIALELVLHHPGLERPLAFLGGVRIARLLADLDCKCTLGSLLSCWANRLPPAHALSAVFQLLQAGVLVPVVNEGGNSLAR